MEAWPNKQFLKVRVETIHSSRITFLDAEYRNRIYFVGEVGSGKERGVIGTRQACDIAGECCGTRITRRQAVLYTETSKSPELEPGC